MKSILIDQLCMHQEQGNLNYDMNDSEEALFREEASFLRGSFLWERKPRLMPNQSNFKGSCFGLSLGRSLGPKLRPNQASLDLCLKV